MTTVSQKPTKVSSDSAKETCGIIMPISEIDGLTSQHWLEVKAIISDAIENAGFTPSLVSDSNEVTIIHSTIIQNIYDNKIIVADVSGKNPNVMFELGLRLAFDKPTVVIKDNQTSYSFDTAPLEHIEYPRDLRFHQIKEFSLKLSEKIKNTSAAVTDTNYSPFLKHFGKFTLAKIESQEVSRDEYLIESIKQLSDRIDGLSSSVLERSVRDSNNSFDTNFEKLIKSYTDEVILQYESNTPITNEVVAKRVIEKYSKNTKYPLTKTRLNEIYEITSRAIRNFGG